MEPLRQRFSPSTTRAAAIAAVNLAVALFCLLVLVPRAEADDDFILHAMQAGAYGKSTVYVHFLGLGLSYLLLFLQQTFSSLNWLMVLQYVFTFAAFAMFGLALTRRGGRTGFMYAFALAMAAAPNFYIRLNFTKSAMLLGAAGLLLVYFALETKKICLPMLLGGSLLATLGASFRLKAFLAAAAFVFVVMLFVLFDRKSDSLIKGWLRRNQRYFIGFGILFICIFGLWGLKQGVYQMQGEADYPLYCETRAAVSDYAVPNYDQNYEAYRALGLTRNDIALIASWDFADLAYFPTETLAAVAEMIPQKTIGMALRDAIADAPAFLYNQPLFWIAAATLTALSVLCRKRALLLSLALTTAFAAGYLFQSYIGRSTRWVVLGMLISYLLALGVSAVDGQLRSAARLQKILPASLAITATLAGLFLYIPYAGDYSASFDAQHAAVYAQLNADSDILYLASMNDLPRADRMVPTFSAVPANLYGNIYVLGGWDSGSVPKNSILERYGASSSPYQALITHDNVFLLDRDDYLLKVNFVFEHVDATAHYSIVDWLNDRYVIAFAVNLDVPQTDESLTLASAQIESCAEDLFYNRLTLLVPDLPADGALYVELTAADGSRMTYRALADDTGSSIEVWAPVMDFIKDNYTARVLAVTDSGVLASNPLALSQSNAPAVN